MALKIHHLSCASFCLRGGRWLGGEGGPLAPVKLVCHCLLVETRDGLVLVDTGFGLEECQNHNLLPRDLRLVLNPRLDPAETAIEQIRALGFKPEDVRHILLTHLDPDHAGGLADFPKARVHVWATELAHASAPSGFRERSRYLQRQWSHRPDWCSHQPDGERWFGFDRVQALTQDEDQILMIPLVGHTHGHCGIAVSTAEGWLLHCGDAYFHHSEMQEPPRCPPVLKGFQRILALDNRQRLENQRRLRVLANREDGVRVFCAHDQHEFLACCHERQPRGSAQSAAEKTSTTGAAATTE